MSGLAPRFRLMPERARTSKGVVGIASPCRRCRYARPLENTLPLADISGDQGREKRRVIKWIEVNIRKNDDWKAVVGVRAVAPAGQADACQHKKNDAEKTL